MSEIYQIFGSQGKELAYQLLTRIDPDLSPEMTIGIKPNLVLAKASDSGATTDPKLVAGVIEYLLENNITNIIIMEGAWVGANTQDAFQVCGYEQLATKYNNVELYNLKEDSTREYSSEEVKMSICQTPIKVDYLINMPVLKAHCQTKLTCALKNLKGCLPDREKRRFHRLGLHQPIAYLNKFLKSDLVIVDGIIGDLTFEEGGNPVQMNRVLAGTDSVLIDSYVAQLLGLEITEVPYIKLAAELGLGKTQTEEKVKSLNQPQEISLDLTKGRKIADLKEHIKAKEACSACLGSLIHALQRIEEEFEILNRDKIYIGQGWKENNIPGLGVGNCTKQATEYIPGCPPTAKEIVNKLQKYWQLNQ